MRSTLGVYDEQELDMYRDRFEVKNIISKKQTVTKTNRDGRRSKMCSSASAINLGSINRHRTKIPL